MARPKIYLLYWKTVVDRCIERFLSEKNDMFARDDASGGYVYRGTMSATELRRLFLGYVKDELSKYVPEYAESAPETLFVIGSCPPGDNVLRDTMGRAPKLRKILEIVPDVRYFMKESDIKLDMRLFNDVLDGIFARFMKERKKTWRNVFFIRHRRLDCYMLYRMLKRRYGRMAVNLHKKLKMGEDRVIFSINDMIDKADPLKDTTLENGWYGDIETEVYQYADTCLSGGF